VIVPEKIGVLLVAGGFTHQENYGPGFQADARCRVIGVTDERDVDARRASLNRKLAETMRIPYLPDLEKALEQADVHAVSICAEHDRQGRIGVRCAAAGKHLYMDKPVAGSLEDAQALDAAVKRSRVRSQMFSMVNLAPAQRARKIVESGSLGELKAIHCDLLFAKGHPGSAPLGQARKEQYPPSRFIYPDAKREMFNTAVYSLALIRWLTRRKAFRTVRAVTANYFFQEHHQRGFEDFGALALTLDGGVGATITSGRIGWASHPGSGPNLVRLFGTTGSVAIDAFVPRAEIASDLLQWSPPARDPEDPMGFWKSSQERTGARPRPGWLVPEQPPVRSDQSLFLDCIEQRKEAEVTVADGASIVEALMAAYRSAATGDVEKIASA
jgi:predicted dehydrogenase